MSIPEYVTVTILVAPSEELGDFRIPSGMTVGRLTRLLAQEWEDLVTGSALWFNGYMLPPDCTLADAGIWDGSIITVRRALQ